MNFYTSLNVIFYKHIRSNLTDVNKRCISLQQYQKFADVDILNGVHFYSVTYTGTDPNAPNQENTDWWWNCIDFGITNRLTRIAIQAFKRTAQCVIYVRCLHDDGWSNWYQVTIR